MGFEGFPQAGLQFLRDLESNNNKEWFEANKDTYTEKLMNPAVKFVAALGERLKNISDGIRYDTRTNGSGSLMRIYRDVRFSPDKTPYKTNISMLFWEGEGKKMQNPAFGFQFQAHEGGGMSGMFGFDKSMLEAYHQAVVDDVLGAELSDAVQKVKSAGEGYEVHGKHYKRVPRGYDADHPRAEYLLYNGLHAYCPSITPDEMISPDLVDICYTHCVNMAPVQQWLVKVRQHQMV